MYHKKTYGKILLIILAMFTSIAINIKLDTSLTLGDSLKADEIIIVVMAILYYIMLKKVIGIKDKRAQIVAITLAIIFAAFEIVGYSTNQYLSLDGIVGSKMILLKNSIKFAGYCITFYGIILLLITKGLNKIKNSKIGESRYWDNTKLVFSVCALIILISYLPYFLHYYPGMFTIDSVTEMNSAIISMGDYQTIIQYSTYGLFQYV